MSVERDTFPGLLRQGAQVFGDDSSYWLDLGTPSAFVAGSADLVAGVAPTAAMPKAAVHDSERLILIGSEVADTATITGGSTVGTDVVIGPSATVHSSVIMDGVQIGAGTGIERSVVCRGARIGAGCTLSDAVIGDNAVLEPAANCSTEPGCGRGC